MRYVYKPGVKFIWVTGLYSGDKAKSVMAHESAGIGYFVLKHGGTKTNPSILAAFRRVVDGPLPEHLSEIKDSALIKSLNEKFNQRNNIRTDTVIEFQINDKNKSGGLS